MEEEEEAGRDAPRPRPGSQGRGGAWVGTKCPVYILGGEARWGGYAARLPGHVRGLTQPGWSAGQAQTFPT